MTDEQEQASDLLTVPAEDVLDGDVILSLSRDEANALLDVTDHIGGPPHTTRRGLIDDIRVALIKAGITGTRPEGACEVEDIDVRPTGIYFTAVTD